MWTSSHWKAERYKPWLYPPLYPSGDVTLITNIPAQDDEHSTYITLYIVVVQSNKLSCELFVVQSVSW